MKVKVHTKSNYRNLNGKWLKVLQLAGKRVTCVVDLPDFGRQNVDFTIDEIIAIGF